MIKTQIQTILAPLNQHPNPTPPNLVLHQLYDTAPQYYDIITILTFCKSIFLLELYFNQMNKTYLCKFINCCIHWVVNSGLLAHL